MQETRSQAGFASLHVGHVHGASAVLGCRSRTPVSLLTPRARGASVWAYSSSFGGGMVAGVSVTVDIQIDRSAVCFLGSQASNKVYRNPHGLPCSHSLRANIGADALLVLAPDPVQCFTDSNYEQRQIFQLATSANLVLVDWFTAGRMARGERWCFRRYYSRNAVVRDEKKILIDAIALSNDSLPLTNRFRSGRFNCIATAILIGPALQSFATELLATIARDPISPQGEVLSSASPLNEGAILRIAGPSIEAVGHALSRFLQFVPQLLKDDPWVRKW